MILESVFVAVAVAGFIEFMRRAFAKEWQGAIIIVGSALIGALAGWLKINGLDVPNGIVTGLFASGLITVASKFGNNTSPRV